MRNILSTLSLAFLIVLFSCTGNKENKTTNMQDSLATSSALPANAEYKDNSISLEAGKDTILNGKNFTYSIIAISKADYDGLKAYPNSDSITILDVTCPNDSDCSEKLEAARIPDTSLIKREGTILKLKLKDGTFRLIENSPKLDPNKDDTDYHYHYFEHYIKDIGLYILSGYYYEWSETLLVNDKNGDSIIVFGYPIVSPDRNKILCYNEDMEAGFSNNGFQVLTTKGGKIEEDIKCELRDWGPFDVVWTDNNTIKMIQKTFEADTSGAKKKFCKIVIK